MLLKVALNNIALTLHRFFLPNFNYFGQMVLEKISFKLANHKQELPIVAILVVRFAQNMEILYRNSHTSFLQSNNLLCLLVSEEKISQIRNKTCAWQPCFLFNRDEIRNLNRGPSIDVSNQVSVYLVKRFQRRCFLEMDQQETSIAYGGHVC